MIRGGGSHWGMRWPISLGLCGTNCTFLHVDGAGVPHSPSGLPGIVVLDPDMACGSIGFIVKNIPDLGELFIPLTQKEETEKGDPGSQCVWEVQETCKLEGSQLGPALPSRAASLSFPGL